MKQCIASGKSFSQRHGNVLSCTGDPYSWQISLFVVPEVNQSPKALVVAVFRGR